MVRAFVLLLGIISISVWTTLLLRAQGSGGALVLTTCGVLPQPYAIGSTRQVTVDVNGVTCM
jgi:hypothetical protein